MINSPLSLCTDTSTHQNAVNSITGSSCDSDVSLDQYGGEILNNLVKLQCSANL